jgi:hypothetical protein
MVDQEREKVIRAAWKERGVRQWDPETHGRGLLSLNIPAKIEMLPQATGTPLPRYDNLEFRSVRATLNGQPVDSIVCEGVVVESDAPNLPPQASTHIVESPANPQPPARAGRIPEAPPPRHQPAPETLAWQGPDQTGDQIRDMYEERRRRSVAAATMPSGATETPPPPVHLSRSFMAGADRASTPLTLRATESQPAPQSVQVPAEPSASTAPLETTSVIEQPESVTLATSVSRSDLPDVDSIPPQLTTGSQFALDTHGRIDLVPDPPQADDGVQREVYQEVRHKALALSALGHNQLADLSEPIARFLAAAPERFEDGSITRLWSRGNTLRLRLKAHDAAVASPDPSDPARLLALVAEQVRDVVETFNVFIARDPKGRELDQVRLGPQDRGSAMATIEAAVLIVQAVKESEGVATAAAKEILAEQVEAALDAPPGIDGDQAIDLARKTTSNFVVEMLRAGCGYIRAELGFGWKEGHSGFYRAAGAAIFVGGYAYQQEIISFIAKNADTLKAFVEQALHNPALIRVIEVIAAGS